MLACKGRRFVQSLRKHAFVRYLRYAGPYRWLLATVILVGIVKFTLPLIPAYLVRLVVDKVIRNKENLELAYRQHLLIWYGAAMLAVMVAEAVATYVRGVATVKVASAVIFDFRQDLWKHLQRLHLGFHQSRPTGTLLSRLINDISQSQQMIRGGIINVAIDAVSGVVAVVVLMHISWQLTLLVLSILPVYGMLYRRVNPALRQASHDVQEQRAVISGTAVERLNGIAVVQSFAQEDEEERYFAVQAQELRGRSIRHGKIHQLLNSASEFLVETASAMVWIVGGWLAITTTNVSPGQLIQFTASAALLYRPIRRFSEINIIYQDSMAAIERVFAIFDVVPDVQDKPAACDATPGMGTIQFDHVRFQYGQGPMVLKDLSFSILPGERVAIVGESGAGKSTLVTLIPRLFDVTGGAIRIDGIDLRDYKLHRLRRSIGIVLQDTILFSGTIRENLRYGRKGASDAEIVEAAKAANAHDFITSSPDGYETIIGERGVTLSGGQRQRVSLARTILQNPRILILDEATSSLDSESENLIVEALDRVMAGRTCMIIAHRLSTVMGADRLLVLRNGGLVEQGSHGELLGAGGYYRYLFEQQFGPLQDLLMQDWRNGPAGRQA